MVQNVLSEWNKDFGLHWLYLLNYFRTDFFPAPGIKGVLEEILTWCHLVVLDLVLFEHSLECSRLGNNSNWTDQWTRMRISMRPDAEEPVSATCGYIFSKSVQWHVPILGECFDSLTHETTVDWRTAWWIDNKSHCLDLFLTLLSFGNLLDQLQVALSVDLRVDGDEGDNGLIALLEVIRHLLQHDWI